MTNCKTLLGIIMLLFFSEILADEKNVDELHGQGSSEITINNIRNFITNSATIFKEDGVIAPQSIGQGGTGFKVRYRVGSDASPDLTSGTIEEIDFINTHKGPITSVDPFKIFNIDALITADTFFDDNLSLENINIGDELKVSGFIDINSTVLVSRIESDDDPLTEWKISGYVSNLTTNQFNIHNQIIQIDGVIADNCDMGLINGEFVEIKATPDPQFMAGSPLSTVTDIECVPPGIGALPGDVIPVALEGFIDSEDIELNNVFTVAGQVINVSASTVYINGEIDDIVIGAKLEVEGLLNTTSSEIEALRIKFKEVRFKFEEPVLPGDVIVGESIQLFGRTIMTTPQLRDEDGIIGSGLNSETQVEVRGYADNEGNLFATRVRERGNPDASEVSADGQINAINEPMIEVFGITVDTTTSVFFDINGMPINATDFFAMITIGTEIEVEDAFVNESTNVISGGVIRIDEPDDGNRSQNQALGASIGLGIGTVTGQSDVIFANSFE